MCGIDAILQHLPRSPGKGGQDEPSKGLVRTGPCLRSSSKLRSSQRPPPWTPLHHRRLGLWQGEDLQQLERFSQVSYIGDD